MPQQNDLAIARSLYKLAASIYTGAATVLFLGFSTTATGDLASAYMAVMGILGCMFCWSFYLLCAGTKINDESDVQQILGFTASSRLYFQIMTAITFAGIITGFELNRLFDGFLGLCANVLFLVSLPMFGLSILLIRALSARVNARVNARTERVSP